MLPDDHKQAVRDLYRSLSDGTQGFSGRTGQRRMIGLVANTVGAAQARDPECRNGQNILVVEGRTGVGKTFGYLVPLLALCKAVGKKVVISTATVGLQQQLVDRDLPAVARYCATKVSFGLVKGRNRYVCPARLFNHSCVEQGLFEDDEWERALSASDRAMLDDLAKRLSSGKWKGDRDALEIEVPGELWRRISTDSSGCTKQQCSRSKECPYYIVRNELRDADVLVANHDLVLACLESESNLLPALEQTIYCFDEAHHLPEIAVRRYQSTSRVLGTESRLKSFFPLIAKLRPYVSDPNVLTKLTSAIERMAAGLKGFWKGIDASSLLAERQAFRFPMGELTGDVAQLALVVSLASRDAFEQMASVVTMIDGAIESDHIPKSSVEELARGLHVALASILVARDVWASFVKSKGDGPPAAKWIEKTKDGRDYAINCAPLSAADALCAALWNCAAGVILTSATLQTLGSFRFFLRDSGLDRYPSVSVQCVESPFDYGRQGQIRVPRLKSDPKDPVAHTAEIVAELPALLRDDVLGTLVLFASKNQMDAVAAALPPDVMSTTLVQGSSPRAELIRRHIEAVNAGRKSILFGLAGFGEGLDLPGRQCEHVIIAKIPFAPPDSPLEEAQAEWIEHRGGNAFAELSLPKACFTLVQWSGRLIRTEQDTGWITFLDARIRTKSYGKKLLASLPPMTLVA